MTGPQDAPTRPLPAGRAAPPRWLRVTESVAGLLSGGVMALAVVLLIARFVAPALDQGATGPTSVRVVAPFVVGLLGEAGVLLRPRWSVVTVRGAVAVGTMLAVVAVIAVGWWGL